MRISNIHHGMLIIGMLFVSADLARGQMVRNDSIGNDPAKEQLCAERAKNGEFGKVETVPFEIDSGFVARARSPQYGGNADVTFIAVEGSITSQLVECSINSGTGKYGPSVSMSEQPRIWHLIKPKQFEPGVSTRQGTDIAENRCDKAALEKINRPNFDHRVFSGGGIVEVNIGKPLYHPGSLIAGKVADRYDVVVNGTALYKSSGPDLDAVQYTCLFSPMLDLKAVQFK